MYKTTKLKTYIQREKTVAGNRKGTYMLIIITS